ncbi:MAG: serine/threonine protein kinase [Actinomycetota bacterium]|nr:serine/threonine protein kinase [Actinomycetota bacterium]
MAQPMTYEVVRRLGRGGMGVVDLAESADGVQVALKRLPLHGTPEELARARQRVRREAAVLGALDHPGIVGLREVHDTDDDIVLVMDYLPGGNLATRVAEQGPLPAADVLRLADQLLDALAAAHRQGIVHRDLKPANVLFAADGHPLLADFGVASSRDVTPGLTGNEMVVGTPGFMAPEQARGEIATAASDVFSLGATLAFAATGRGPFGEADPRVLMMRAASGRVEKLPRSLPADLRHRLDPLLDRNPLRRPTAAEACGGPAGTSPHPRRGRRWHGRYGAAVGGVGVALLLVGAAAAVLIDNGHSGRPGRNAGQHLTGSRGHTSSTSRLCRPAHYQPCGGQPAPSTDGRHCVAGHADYDGNLANGCEAAPDRVDGSTVHGAVRANLVPATDTDTYKIRVKDHFQLTCDGRVHVTLIAPSEVTERLVVRRGAKVVATATSADRQPGSAVIKDPNCGSDDTETLTARVSSVGTDRSDHLYTLRVSGSY